MFSFDFLRWVRSLRLGSRPKQRSISIDRRTRLAVERLETRDMPAVIADLVGTSFSVYQTSATPGSTVGVGISIANQGGSAANGFYGAIVLSQDGYINTATDRVLAYQWFNGLGAYSSTGLSTSV